MPVIYRIESAILFFAGIPLIPLTHYPWRYVCSGYYPLGTLHYWWFGLGGFPNAIRGNQKSQRIHRVHLSHVLLFSHQVELKFTSSIFNPTQWDSPFVDRKETEVYFGGMYIASVTGVERIDLPARSVSEKPINHRQSTTSLLCILPYVGIADFIRTDYECTFHFEGKGQSVKIRRTGEFFAHPLESLGRLLEDLIK